MRCYDAGNRILLQRKYSRIIEMFARSANIPLEQALDFFYHSELYQEMSEGISDMTAAVIIILWKRMEHELEGTIKQIQKKLGAHLEKVRPFFFVLF